VRLSTIRQLCPIPFSWPKVKRPAGGWSLSLASAATGLLLSLSTAPLLGAGAAAPPSVERSVLPSQTDAAIDSPNDPHFVVNPNPAAEPRNRLFVMLPGTGANPRVYHLIVEEAAKRGYHAIGLDYPSSVAIGTACEHSADLTCFGKVRQKLITGQDATDLVKLSPANAIVPRLGALLRYLSSTYPNEGWGQYLGGAGEILWNKVEVGGHSQGSGHTGYMTKLYPLARACFFSFGYDYNDKIPMPAWIHDRNVTPASRMYGFINANDEIIKIAAAEEEWKILGMYAFGEPASVDGSEPPYRDSHILVTAHPPAPTTPARSLYPNHSEPIVDIVTPKNPDGSPLHAATWDTLCFP